MANNFILKLDTTGPINPILQIDSGANYASNQLVTCSISTDDSNTTGYKFKIWGDVDPAYNPKIQSTQGNSDYIDFTSTQTVKLLTGDGTKTLNLVIYDDVLNPSVLATSTIVLDTTAPVVTINGPAITKISKIEGKDTSAFSFQCNAEFTDYEVRVVETVGADHTMGTIIPTTAGSTNMVGSAGNYAADTPINCQIKGSDLQTASTGDGDKIIKVFVKDSAGNWSI